MPTHKVTFNPAGVTVEVDPKNYPFGRDGDPGSLLDIALAHDVHIEHACGGEGVCATCHIIVEQGMENLSEAYDDELDRVDYAPSATPNSRLACKAVVNGDVTITVPDWNRNAISEDG